MEYSINLDDSGKFVNIVTVGDIHVEDVAIMAQEGLAYGQVVKCHRFLLDYRLSISRDTKMQIYDFVSHLDTLGLPRDVMISILISGDEDKHGLAQTVAEHKGWNNIRSFEDPDKATEWLVAV